jgi:hypothetical protein
MDTTSPGSGPRVAGLIVGGIGAVLALAGTLVAIYAPGAVAARHERMAALPSPDAVVLADSPPGREVLIDGRIAPDQPVLFRNFVAFIKEEEERSRSDDDRKEWKVRERRAPPLHIVRTGDESTRVVNFAYGLWGAKSSWRDESQIIDTRYTGLVTGEAVVVHGRTVTGGLEAIEVASGTRASYLAEIASGVGVAWWLGVGLAVAGGVLLTIAVILFVTAVKMKRASAR